MPRIYTDENLNIRGNQTRGPNMTPVSKPVSLIRATGSWRRMNAGMTRGVWQARNDNTNIPRPSPHITFEPRTPPFAAQVPIH